MPARCAGVDGRDNFHKAVFGGDFDAEAAEFTAGLHLHVFEIARVHITGMRIEMRDHAVDRGIDQFFIFHFADVIRADAFERVAEKIELTIGR
jgi:hypothetical protein